MLAIVDTLADAEAAAVAGAPRIGLRLGQGDEETLRALSSRGSRLLCPLSLLHDGPEVDAAELLSLGPALRGVGVDEIRVALERGVLVAVAPLGLRVVGIVAPDRIAEGNLARRAVSLGAAGLMVADRRHPRRRLLDALDLPALAHLAGVCRASDLILSASGGVEWADVPRLLAIGVNEIGFDAVLRAEGREGVSITAERVTIAQDLVAAAARVRDAAPATLLGEPDHIFVRDWVLAIGIGAYAHERDAPQRVRFSVDAEIARQAGRLNDLRDIVSYDLITDAIRRLVAEHVDLVETLAERIADAVLGHARVLAVTVTVEKLDLGPPAVGCRIRRERSRP